MPSKKLRAKHKKQQKAASAAQPRCDTGHDGTSRWTTHLQRSECFQCQSTTDVAVRFHVHPTQGQIILANVKDNIKYRRVMRRLLNQHGGGAPVCAACMAHSYPDDVRPWVNRHTHLTRRLLL